MPSTPKRTLHAAFSILAAGASLVACASSSPLTFTLSSSCYVADYGQCLQNYWDSPDMAAQCATMKGLYHGGGVACPTASAVGSCECEQTDGKMFGPVTFYGPRYTCAQIKQQCSQCNGTFTGRC